MRAETSRAGRNILRKKEGEFPAAGLMQSAEVLLEKKAMPERGRQKSWSRELSSGSRISVADENSNGTKEVLLN